MTPEQIKIIIQEMAIKPHGANAVVTWDIDEIATAIYAACKQYKIDPRLALAQGILEGHFATAPTATRSRKTRNIYNVGNVDDGTNKFFPTYTAGIRAYAHLLARSYCYRSESSIVTPEMMIAHDFWRPDGVGRYATAHSYTKDIAKIVKKIDKIILKNGGDNANSTSP